VNLTPTLVALAHKPEEMCPRAVTPLGGLSVLIEFLKRMIGDN
jgi:hypothetical protein